MKLGNLTVEQIEQRSGVSFPKELKDYMEPRHQSQASNIAKGKWHCFDLPFILLCGDMETAEQIYKHLKSMSADFKEPLQIGVEG